jgi:hypothetical protein
MRSLLLLCHWRLYTRAIWKFVDWWQCATVMQREAVTVTPCCSGGGNASSGVIFSPATIVRVWVTVVLKEPFLGWRSNYKGSLESLWTGGSAPLLCRGKHNSGALPPVHELFKWPSYVCMYVCMYVCIADENSYRFYRTISLSSKL